MHTKAEERKAEIIDGITARLVGNRLGGDEAAVAERFVRAYYRDVAPEDLAERDPLDLYGAALAHLRLAYERQPGRPMIRVYNPKIEESGWQSTHTIIEIVNDDMPFLVDSISNELHRHGLRIHLIIRPALVVRRDADGRLIDLDVARETGNWTLRESFMHIEVDRQSDPAVLARLENNLRYVLDGAPITPAMRGGSSREALPNPDPSAPRTTKCHIYAEMAERPTFGRRAELHVTLSREALSKTLGLAAQEGHADIGMDREIAILVHARSNCRVLGSDRETVPPPAPGRMEELIFEVEGFAEGPAELWVEARQGARKLLTLVLQPVFVAAGKTTAAAVLRPEQEELPMVELRIIDQTVANDEPVALRFVLSSPDLGVELEAQSSPSAHNARVEFIAEIYKEIESHWHDLAMAPHLDLYDDFLLRLRAYGVQLFQQLVPAKIQDVLWRHRDRIGCVRVISREPSIPWEILHLKDPAEAGVPLEEPLFLAELGLVRWHNDLGYPPVRLRLRTGFARYVVPEYGDPGMDLPAAREEQRLLAEIFGATPVTPTRDEVLKLLNFPGRFDLLHFACHGHANREKVWRSGLYLARRSPNSQYETLGVTEVATYARLGGELGGRPAVFLNACQVGHRAQMLIGTGGMADAFLGAGAGMFVAPLWSVGDRSALTFARTLYKQLKAGNSLAEAGRAARQAAKVAREPTWLAYTIYGHPYARLEFEEAAGIREQTQQ